MKASTKDIIRTIKKEKKRFIAISIIVALGVSMTTGLRASCEDLRKTTDQLFDESNLYDICIQSTLGLEDEDINTLKEVENVDEVEGCYEETIHIKDEDTTHSASLKTLTSINTPYLLEGTLPSSTNEVVISSYCATDMNKELGDEITIIQDEENIKRETFKIVGIALDPTDINAKEGATAFRSSSTNEYTFYVLKDNIDSDLYTSIYITLKNSKEMNCFSDDYKQYVDDTSNIIANTIKEDRQDARTESIKQTALEEIEKQENKANKKLNNAKKKLDDAKKELDEAKEKLDQAQITLNKNKQASLDTFNNYYDQISNGQDELNAKEKELLTSKETINSSIDALNQNHTLGYIDDLTYNATLSELNKNLESIQTGLDTIQSKKAELNFQKEILDSQLVSANKQLEEAQVEIDTGLEEYNKGLKEYNDGLKEYNKSKKESLQKIEDAKEEVNSIDEATWYIQSRVSLSSYNNVASDTGAIESLGVVFSITFLIVAVLVCLTTINRMIDEDRGLVGCYQALGYYLHEIQLKYVLYAFIATLLGAILGDLLGFIGLPAILRIIFTTMYQLPYFKYAFNYFYGLGAPVLFVLAILLSVFFTCQKSLALTPATLMRPKSPKKGSRVLLERTPLWSHLSFLNKVTIRNLFRYKKRLFMTLIGIALCNSLLVCGFGIKDSVEGLRTKQYNDVTLYDAMYVSTSSNHKKLGKLLKDTNYIECYISNVSLKYEDHNENVQLYVLDADDDLSSYLGLKDIDTHKEVSLDEGIIVTRNASIVEEFNSQDTVSIQDLSCSQYDFKVTHIVENYLGNSIFMSKDTYNKTFKNYESNGYLVNSSDTSLLSDVSKEDIVLSSVIKQDLMDSFKQSFKLINLVVYIVIVFAALLAFAVLFTLSTTNISERERELATIKVLGFFDSEVHTYVNKETIILTAIGILLGIPFGYLFTNYLTGALKMPSLYFAVSIHLSSYIISCAIALIFALLVNIMTNKTLNHIDMVEALKSIE